MRGLVIVVVLGALFRPAVAEENGMRCPGGLIFLDDREAVVAQKCGPPTTADRRDEESWIHGVVRRSQIDTWTYDRGPHTFVRILTFVDGVLRSVELGDYGKA